MKLRIRQQTKTFALATLMTFVMIRFLPTATFVHKTALILDLSAQPEESLIILDTLRMLIFITTLPLSAIFDIYLATCLASLFVPKRTGLLQPIIKDYLNLEITAETFKRLFYGAVIANICPYAIQAIAEQKTPQNHAMTDFAIQASTVVTFALIMSIIGYYAFYRSYMILKILFRIYMSTYKT